VFRPAYHDGHNHDGHKVGLYQDGHSNEKRRKTNGVLFRNRQIHGEFTVPTVSRNRGVATGVYGHIYPQNQFK